MPAPRLIRYESVPAWRAAAAPWDDLWQRSANVLPTGRAELVVQWLEQFAPHGRFVAVAVEHEGQLIAALPLLERRMAGVIPIGCLPRNDWCWAGHLLLDPSADIRQALALLLDEVRRLPWPLLKFDTVPIDRCGWPQLLAALDEAEMTYTADERFQIGTVEIADMGHNWERYQASWSGNHRRHMRKALRKAEEEGGVELELRGPTSTAEVESLLREGFDVEHRSWKGRAGSSVLASPDTWKFYLRQATQLAEWGHLELAFLRYRNQAIAFEYGWSADGIYYTPKVGFDDDFSRFSPGQLLRYRLLEDAFARTNLRTIDYLGPLSDATAKWTTGSYPISRLIVATGKIGRGLLWSGRNIVRPLHAVS